MSDKIQPNIFQIKKHHKSKKPICQANGEKNQCFKITKARSPWLPQEDDYIVKLVEKNGTKNWTLIAEEMLKQYGIKHRSGKQCRERWHNHLDPNLKKDDWSEKEEMILFEKHEKLGNRWSEIATFLPGRSDNCIKNHFYSKLRKMIRKLLKLLAKDNAFKRYSIDVNKYNSEKIYRLIKKYMTPYNSLSKEIILDLIFRCEKNLSTGETEKKNLSIKKKKRKHKLKNKHLKIRRGINRVELENEKSNVKSDIIKNNQELIEQDRSKLMKFNDANQFNPLSPNNFSFSYEIEFRQNSFSPINKESITKDYNKNLYSNIQQEKQNDYTKIVISPSEYEGNNRFTFNFESNFTPNNCNNNSIKNSSYNHLNPRRFIQTPENYNYQQISPREINIQQEQILINELEYNKHFKHEDNTKSETEAKTFFAENLNLNENCDVNTYGKKCKYFSSLQKKKNLPEISIENDNLNSIKIFQNSLENSVQNFPQKNKIENTNTIKPKLQNDRFQRVLNISPASAFYKPKKNY